MRGRVAVAFLVATMLAAGSALMTHLYRHTSKCIHNTVFDAITFGATGPRECRFSVDRTVACGNAAVFKQGCLFSGSILHVQQSIVASPGVDTIVHNVGIHVKTPCSRDQDDSV